jgi:hypothetical protein
MVEVAISVNEATRPALIQTGRTFIEKSGAIIIRAPIRTKTKKKLRIHGPKTAKIP